MIETNYVPIYMKINHIFFVIKGQFPVMDYIPNTIILYFIVHCIYVLCLFYCTTYLRLSLTPPVSGLRCTVFNKVIFCSVLITLSLLPTGVNFANCPLLQFLLSPNALLKDGICKLVVSFA